MSDNLTMMRDSLIRERMGFLIELIDDKDPSFPALWQFAEMIIDDKNPPLIPPNGRALNKKFKDTWLALHEAWFIHNLIEGT